MTDSNGVAVNIGGFTDSKRNYSGSVESDVTYVTITHSVVTCRLVSEVLPPDSRPDENGHQIPLQHGDNLISVVLMTGLTDDNLTVFTYDVTITRAGSPSGTPTPEISAYGLRNGIAKEGHAMPFILTRTGDPSESLSVSVNVSETGGDVVPHGSEGTRTIRFPAGDATAKLSVSTVADLAWEEHSTITVAVVDGPSYELNSGSGSASSLVKDNDVPPMKASFSLDSSQAREGDVVTVSVTVTTDGPKEPHNYVGNLNFRPKLGSAQPEDFYIPFGSDYSSFPDGHRITGGTYSYGAIIYGDLAGASASFAVNLDGIEEVVSGGSITHYQHEFSVPILIVDDERAENEETFSIELGWDSYHESKNPLTMDQGITSRTITIPAHDDTPGAYSSGSYVAVEMAHSGSAGSTYTVSWHDTGRCTGSQKYQVYLTMRDTGGWTMISKLGETANTNTQFTVSKDFFPLSGQRNVVVYCGDMIRTVGEVPVPSATENSVERPVPGTYSSRPALTSLTISPGTLGPAFNSHGFLYSVLDIPAGENQITLKATARDAYSISWNPSEDADPNADGHQVNLSEGYNSIFISVDHDQGINSFTYEVIVKGSGLKVSQNENTLATGSPTITGTPQVGETLTASTSGIADADGLTSATFAYQWVAGESDINGATSSSYALTSSEQGKAIKVRVTFTDDAGHEESLTSGATTAVAAAPSPLTASVHSTPASHDGGAMFTFELRFSETPKDDFSYRTLRDHAFTVAGGEVTNARRLEPGKNVRWEITVQPSANADVTIVLPVTTDCDAQGAVCTGDGRMLSTGVELVTPGPPNSPATGAPSTSGTVQVGETLTAGTSGIADADGLTSATFAYQWVAGESDINGATGSSYALTSSEQGKAIKVRVTFTDDAGHEESLTSGATTAVAARPNSPATGAPTISGTAQVGETLTAGTSGIADSNGLTSATFAYQWVGGESDINGATGSSYALTSSDQSKTIKVRVAFTDDAGHEESLTSGATTAVAAAPSPLTASVHSRPASHDGSAMFTFELRFSETPKDDFSYRTLRDHAFTVTGGEVTNARRLEPGKNVRWEITVRPSGNANVTVSLPATTDCASQGAVCTSDGRKLSQRVELTVPGPGQ